MVALDLADITAVRERIVTESDGGSMPIAAYRRCVEETTRQLVAQNPVLQRLQDGADISDADVRALADLLARQSPQIDEEKLGRVYDVRHAGLVRLIRHVLGVETLERYSTFVTRSFEECIADHTTISALQIRFLQTLRTFIIQRGSLERRDLVDSPFTQLHPQGIRGVFQPQQAEETVAFASGLVG